MTNNTLVSERYLLITCSYHFCRQMYNSKIFPDIFLGSTSTWVREFTKNRVSDFIDFDVLFFHEIRLAVNCSFYPLLCAFINLDRHGRYLVIFFQKSKCWASNCNQIWNAFSCSRCTDNDYQKYFVQENAQNDWSKETG